MNDIRNLLGKERIYFDGGFGTQLQARGIKPGELPETWNLTHPNEVRSIYLDYLKAGAMVINSNTFGASRLKYGDEYEKIITEGVKLAVSARDEHGSGFVTMDIGPTGKLLKPLGDLDYEDAIDIFAEMVRAGAKAGADLILIETMNDTYEAKAAVIAAKENCDLPVIVTCVFDESAKMLTGGTPESMVAIMEGLKVDALGINCSLGPCQMIPIIERIINVSSTPVVINPNAGLPRVEGKNTVYDVDPEEFSDLMSDIARMGASGLGGCCGTTPEYIKKTVEKTKGIELSPIIKKDRSVIASFSDIVEFDKRPIIIGERINPTGKKKFQQALRDKDYDYILGQGIEQEDAGAHVLDVNVGLPDIDEPEMLGEVIKRLQSITSLPLQIDSSDPVAMERALRLYNGKALINSVNGKKEIMDAIFPLVAKYGGMVVALALDEEGIPDTFEDRVKIAERIYNEAEKYGIEKKDILVDGLVMTISANPMASKAALDTVEYIHKNGGKTILGVSNISFGLPVREKINSTFLIMAMQKGLSAAIINPGIDAMMDAYRSYCALSNIDTNFEDYIAAYGGEKSATPVKKQEDMTLKETIIRGVSGKASEAAKVLLENTEPLDVVNNEIIPALNIVGEDFEKGTIFLPQLLMAAEAAQAAFDIVKSKMGSEKGEPKGKVILATVKGDIHDIGKNIVKVLLENYGYEVLDLGKDVAPETILEEAIKHDIKVVGLSALMTTTVVSMEETIKLFRKERPQTKIVVGGAVLTADYASKIGADSYSKDAMGTVHFCDEVF